MIKVTRKQKREKQSEINFFAEFTKIRKHFFSNFNKMLASVKDVRHTSYITYEPDILLFTVIMKNIVGISSMNRMTRDFNTDEAINNIAKSLKIDSLDEIPHYDTINNFLKKLENKQLEKIRDYMIRELLKKRSLEKLRLKDKYWCIAIDATQIASFDQKHCEHCLKKTHINKYTGEVERIDYFHNVLEAKLIVGNMAFSVATEFIENENEEYVKQDCEINAAKRLLKNLKYKFRKLPICILGDSLYSCKPLYDICNKYNWEVIFRFKEGRAKTLWKEFIELKKIESSKVDIHKYVDEVFYYDTMVNLVETNEIKDNKHSKNFVFVTNIKITNGNVAKVSKAGRSRWKIENEGFNNQKNIRYNITHACSLNNNAMKNHYLLVQIADIIRQLLENGSEALKKLNLGIKEISSRLLESFRRDPLTTEDITHINKRTKICLL